MKKRERHPVLERKIILDPEQDKRGRAQETRKIQRSYQVLLLINCKLRQQYAKLISCFFDKLTTSDAMARVPIEVEEN